MFKRIACIIIVIVLMAFSYKYVFAEDYEESAKIKRILPSNGFDYRAENLRYFLKKYNSPLTDYAQEFVKYADAFDIDYRMVPSITGVESTFGKHIPLNSYNAYGWANGNYTFGSWSESVKIVTSTLRTKYINKGAPTLNKIAKRYAPPSNTWAYKVNYFINKIDKLPLDFDIVI